MFRKTAGLVLMLALLLNNLPYLHIYAETNEESIDNAEDILISETVTEDNTPEEESLEIETEDESDDEVIPGNKDAEEQGTEDVPEQDKSDADHGSPAEQDTIDPVPGNDDQDEYFEAEITRETAEEDESDAQVMSFSSSANYKQWSQYSSDYSQIRQYGCWIVAMSKMIVEAGIDTSESFNPDRFAEWEVSKGYIPNLVNDSNQSSDGPNAPVVYAAEKGSTVTYFGDGWDTSESQLWFNINAGYFTIVKVPYSHWVLIDNATSRSTGVIYCYDSYNDYAPANSRPYYANYSSVSKTYVYRVDGIGSADTEVNLSFSTDSLSNDWLNCSFTFTARANLTGQFTAGGVRLYRDGYSDDVQEFSFPNSSYSSNMQFSLATGNYSLAPDQKYWYQYYAIFNGSEYQSDWYSFTAGASTLADLGDDFYAEIRTSGMYLYYQYNSLSAYPDMNQVYLGTKTDAGSVWHFVKQADGAYKVYNSKNQGILSSLTRQAVSQICLRQEGDDRLDRWYISGISGNYILRNCMNTDLVICRNDDETALYGSYYKQQVSGYQPLKLSVNKIQKPGSFTLSVTTDCNSDHDTKFSWTEPSHASGYDYHYVLHIRNVVNGEEVLFADIDPLSAVTYTEKLPKGSYIAYAEAVTCFASTSSNKVSFEVITGVDFISVTDISFNTETTLFYRYTGIDPSLGTHADEIALRYIPYTITPSWASNQNVRWSSDNEACVSVDEKNQVLKINKTGSANITVTTEDGGYSSTKTIQVNYLSKPGGVGFTAIPGTAAEETRFVWGYSNDSVRSYRVLLYKKNDSTGSYETIIDEDTGDVHSYSVQLSPGSYGLSVNTFYTDEPSVSYLGWNAEYDYNRDLNNNYVYFDIPDAVPVSSIVLSDTQVTMPAGETISLTAMISPENATNKKISWSSSDESVAAVNSDGLVSALKAGTVIITALAEDGNQVSASCTITVEERADGENTAVIKGVSAEGAAVSGTEIRVPVELTDNPGFISGAVSVLFNKNIFELTGVEFGIVPDYSSAPIENALNGSYLVQFGDDTKPDNYTDTGTLFTLVFKVKDGAEAGDYTLTIDAPDGMWVDKDVKEIAAEVQDECTITLSDHLAGDLNSDGRVNATDRLLLVRYLAKWDGYEAKISNMKAADIDRNGTVNASDRVILVRYLAKWGGIYDTYFNN